MQELRALLKDLNSVCASNADGRFTALFRRSYNLLGYTSKDAAAALDSSPRNIQRWKSGEKVPPAAEAVLRSLCMEVKERLSANRNAKPVGKAKKESEWAPVLTASQKNRPPPMAKPSTKYPHTSTTFRKQMEPGIHAAMGQALLMARVSTKKDSGKFTREYKGVTRRIFRAAIISAMAFIKGKTNPSSDFLREQGDEAIEKAINKLYEGKETSDAEDDKNLDNYQY
jgi:hypothetical protein